MFDLDLPGLDDFSKDRPRTGNDIRPVKKKTFSSESEDDIDDLLQIVGQKFEPEVRAATAPEPQKFHKSRTSLENVAYNSKYVPPEIQGSSESSEDAKPIHHPQKIDPVEDLEMRISEVNRESSSMQEELRRSLEEETSRILTDKREGLKEAFGLRKKILEEQLEELIGSRKLHEKINSITDSLAYNLDLLNTVSNKLQQNKQNEDLEKTHRFLRLEKSVSLREQNVISQERKLQEATEQLAAQAAQLDRSEEKAKLVQQEQEANLQKEKEYIYEYFRKINEFEQEYREEILTEELRLKTLEETYKKDQENIEKDWNSRLYAISTQEELLEIKEQETNKALEIGYKELSETKRTLETDKREISGIEHDYKTKLDTVEQKEAEAREKHNEFLREKSQFDAEKAEFDQEVQNIKVLSLDLHRQSEIISRSNYETLRERDASSRLHKELEQLALTTRAEQNSLKEFASSLANETKVYEKMRLALVQELHSKTEQQHLEFPGSTLEFNFIPLRPASGGSNRDFSASTYIKNLENYHDERSSIHEYINSENSDLVQSKLDSVGSFAASLKPQSSKASLEEGKSLGEIL